MRLLNTSFVGTGCLTGPVRALEAGMNTVTTSVQTVFSMLSCSSRRGYATGRDLFTAKLSVDYFCTITSNHYHSEN